MNVLIVKVHGPYSLSKDALKEEGTPWLIKCSGEGNLSDVRHFNTPPSRVATNGQTRGQ
jgi:hypothetical protein